jgi:TPR repeat protein
MVFGIIGILLLAGVLLGKISWGWGVLGAIFLYLPATRFWTKYKAASNAILAHHAFNLLSESDRKKVLVAVSAIMSNAKYPSQDPEQELNGMAPEQRYGFLALGMARIGIAPKIGGGWYEVHNPYAEILGAHREIAFVKHQIKLRYGVVVNFGDLVPSTVQRSGLVAQDLATVPHSKHPTLPRDNDVLYYQARAEFDRRDKYKYRSECKNRALIPDFKIFQQLANENYGKAYYPLSVLYSNRGDIEEGQVFEQHYEQLALDWCSANQANQDVELWCDLGEMYRRGPNDDQAGYWFRKAAGQGYIRAQLNMGNYYSIGLGDHNHHDDEEAVKWYRLAADQGDGDAQYSLGQHYANGEGVTQDYEEAVKWIRLAADQGKDYAQRNLAFKYCSGRGVTKDYKEAVKWFRLAADQGDSNSQYYLGLMYGVDREGVPQNYEEAAKWYRLAADQGYDLAQLNLGGMYYKGQGVSQDDEEAAKWYRLAADQGNDLAQFALGGMYYQGQGVSQDYEEAAKWYRLAAAQGNDLAELDLAVMCIEGKCAPQDHKEIAAGTAAAIRPASTWPFPTLMLKAKPVPQYDNEVVLYSH